jgi:hypothetical protein
MPDSVLAEAWSWLLSSYSDWQLEEIGIAANFNGIALILPVIIPCLMGACPAKIKPLSHLLQQNSMA